MQYLIENLGYNQAQIDQLFNENHIEKQTLDDNQAIVLNKTIPLRGKDGFPMRFSEGGEISCVGNINESQTKKLFIKNVVDKLASYPTGYYNRICIIVNENTFKDLTAIQYPNVLYINTKDEAKAEVEKIISGNDLYTVTIPKEQEKIFTDSNAALRKVILMLFTIIVITVIISLYSSVYVRICLSEDDYISYKSIGISNWQISKIILLEMFILYSLSCIMAFIISLPLTFYFQNMMIGDIGCYLYVFPFSLFFIAIFIDALYFVVCSVPLIKRLYKINLVKYLKENN